MARRAFRKNGNPDPWQGLCHEPAAKNYKSSPEPPMRAVVPPAVTPSDLNCLTDDLSWCVPVGLPHESERWQPKPDAIPVRHRRPGDDFEAPGESRRSIAITAAPVKTRRASLARRKNSSFSTGLSTLRRWPRACRCQFCVRSAVDCSAPANDRPRHRAQARKEGPTEAMPPRIGRRSPPGRRRRGFPREGAVRR